MANAKNGGVAEPKIGDRVRYHFIHTHEPVVDGEGATRYDPVWRARGATVVGVHAEPPSCDLDVDFLPEDFEGSSPAKRQSHVLEARGEPQSGEFTR